MAALPGNITRSWQQLVFVKVVIVRTVKFDLYFSCRQGRQYIYTMIHCYVLLNQIPVSSESGCANFNTAIFRSSESVAPTLTLLSLDPQSVVVPT